MSDQKPIVGIGTILPVGTVVSIRRDRVGVSMPDASFKDSIRNVVQYFTFTQIEGMVFNG
jgi:hypothetical protein